jgi:flagellar hook assembly protein FlgD
LISDSDNNYDGWAIDDITVTTNGCTTSYTYKESGSYKPLLRITDDQNATYTWSGSINVGLTGAPNIESIKADKIQGPGPLTVNFTVDAKSVSSTIATYRWDYDGDGVWDWTSDSTGNSQYTYDTPGTYKARLQVVDSNGLTTDSTITIKVDLLIVMSPLVESFNAENGQNITIGYNINGDADITVNINNDKNELVRSLIINQKQSKGDQQVVWDGRDDQGTLMPEGLYYVAFKGKITDGREFVLDLTRIGESLNQTIDLPNTMQPLRNQFCKLSWYQSSRGLLSLFVGTGASTSAVRTIFTKRPYASGNHIYFWDGTNDNGQLCGGGIYYPALNIEEISENGFILQNNKPFIIAMAVDPNYLFIGENAYVETPGVNATTISVDFDLPCQAKVVIRNSSGTVVRTLTDTENYTGHDLLWDGKDKFGMYVGSGTYIAEIRGVSPEGHESEPGRVVLMICY